MNKNYLVAGLLSLNSFALYASNLLDSLELDRESKTAKVCADVKVFLDNEIFTHPNFSGYVIKIYGENDIFDGYKKKKACLLGNYQIDSRGIAPHLNIYDVELEDSQGSDEVNDDLFIDLEENDRLQIKSFDIATRWQDDNITTGTTRLRVSKLATKFVTNTKELNILSEKNFVEEFAYAENKQIPKALKLKTNSAKLNASKDISVIVEVLAEGNDYAPENKEDRKQFEKELKSLLTILGKADSLYMLHSSAKIKVDNENKNHHSILIINKDTLKSLRVFVIKGNI